MDDKHGSDFSFGFIVGMLVFAIAVAVLSMIYPRPEFKDRHNSIVEYKGQLYKLSKVTKEIDYLEE